MVREVLVRVAEFRVEAADAVLASLGLGSCVAVIVHDPERRIGGMAHILLASRSLSRSEDGLGRSPQRAPPAMGASRTSWPRRWWSRRSGSR